MIECIAKQLEFHTLGECAIVGRFGGGAISADGGGLLLSAVEVKTRIVERFATPVTGCSGLEAGVKIKPVEAIA